MSGECDRCGEHCLDCTCGTDNRNDLRGAEMLEREAKRARGATYKAALIATAGYLRSRAQGMARGSAETEGLRPLRAAKPDPKDAPNLEGRTP